MGTNDITDKIEKWVVVNYQTNETCRYRHEQSPKPVGCKHPDRYNYGVFGPCNQTECPDWHTNIN